MARRSYPTDLSEQEWEIVKKIIAKEEPYTTGRHAEVDLREVWNVLSFTLIKPVVIGTISPMIFHRQQP